MSRQHYGVSSLRGPVSGRVKSKRGNLFPSLRPYSPALTDITMPPARECRSIRWCMLAPVSPSPTRATRSTPPADAIRHGRSRCHHLANLHYQSLLPEDRVGLTGASRLPSQAAPLGAQTRGFQLALIGAIGGVTESDRKCRNASVACMTRSE